MKTAVFFDVDDTLIKGQTQKLMVSYFFRKGKVTPAFFLEISLWFLLYKAGIVSKGTGIMTKSYRLVEGLRLEEFKNILSDFFEKDVKPRIYPQAIEKINFHKKMGHEIILLSKSNKILIDIIKNYLNLPLSLATELEVKDGILTGKIKGDIIHGEEKVKLIGDLIQQKNWDLKQSYAYGDHCSDTPILKRVGHPNVINPTEKLKKIAQRYNWTIFSWHL